MRRSIRPAGVLLLALLSLTFVGCEAGKEFTQEEFKKVTEGMDETQVRQILGKPYDTFKMEDELLLWWRVKDQYYLVEFHNQKVTEADGPKGSDEYELFKAFASIVR